jgi:hypothetical protein
MQAEPSSPRREAPLSGAPPHCVFVTGPRGAGKTRWLQLQIGDLSEKRPGARFAVFLAEEGRTRMEGFARNAPGLSVRRLLLPCPCCPALVDLPGALRELAATVSPDWVFFEMPAIAAAGLLAEFDRALGWPRELAVCLDRAWTKAIQEKSLSPFQMALLELAGRVVPNPAGGQDAPGLPRDLRPNLSL